MPIYHLLAQPLNLPAEPGKRIWSCMCGQKVSLPNVQPASQVVQTPNGRTEIMECPACYAGTDEKGEEAPPITEQGDIKPTFDQDLGDVADDQEAPNEASEDGEVLKEERTDFPDT